MIRTMMHRTKATPYYVGVCVAMVRKDFLIRLVEERKE